MALFDYIVESIFRPLPSNVRQVIAQLHSTMLVPFVSPYTRSSLSRLRCKQLGLQHCRPQNLQLIIQPVIVDKVLHCILYSTLEFLEPTPAELPPKPYTLFLHHLPEILYPVHENSLRKFTSSIAVQPYCTGSS